MLSLSIQGGHPFRSLLALSAAVLLFGIGAASAHQAQKQRPPAQGPKTPSKTAPKSAPPLLAAVPFAAGENLAFRVLWSKYSVNAGALQFQVVEQRDFFGRPAWHFRVRGQTIDTMRYVYPLDDQVDSYTDATTLASLQYEMYLHEQGQQQNNTWRMSSPSDPAPAGATAARVPSDTRDPVGLLYAFRAHDWKSAPEMRAPVFDGNHLYQVDARLEQPSDPVTVQAGSFTAARIGVDVSQENQDGKDTSSIHFTLWLAQDATRTPVLIEAALPIGSARVELASRPQ